MSNEFLHALHSTLQNVPPGDRPADGSGAVPWDLVAQRRRGGGGAMAGSANMPPLLKAMWGMVNFNQQPFNYGATPIQVRPVEDRAYLFILNTSLVQTIYVGFGQQPNSSTGIWIGPNNGFYEPWRIPQNDIWIGGSGAGQGVLITAAPSV